MIEYYRLSGGGNDFLALVEAEQVPSEDEIALWCRRGLSLGADGVFLLDRREGWPRTRHFNADGQPATLCLNGTRCAARLALELGWVRDTGKAFLIETGAGKLQALPAGRERIQIEVPVVSEAPRFCSLEARGERHQGWAVHVGVPHFVLTVKEGLEGMDLTQSSPALRHHPHFPDGANINWIEARPDGFAIRTWERGVEAETLACGTGVLAATAAVVAGGLCDLPIEVRTRGGFTFSIDGKSADGSVLTWSLSGDARIVAEGRIHPGALLCPEN
jgi:diaminopimelate epimerase